MRLIPLTLLLGTAIAAHAQNWCPPGATWTYDMQGFVMLQGFTTMTYTHDTILGGFTGQVMSRLDVGLNFDEEVDTMFTSLGPITRHDGPLVYVWGHSEQIWDTLYDFSAVPGDRWEPPFAQPGMCGGPEYGDIIEVLDTGTVVIDGVSLHYLDIHDGFYDGRITERLGWSMGMVIPQGCWVPECMCDLRCYHDVSLNYVRPGFTADCEAITMGFEEQGARSPEVFPNPGTDHFALSLPHGACTIVLFDATGRDVLRAVINGDRANVYTSALDAGLYQYVVLDVDGASLGQGKWIKE